MRITNEQNSAAMVTINLKVGMCRDIIANSNITKAYVVNPCDSSNTYVNTPLNAIHEGLRMLLLLQALIPCFAVYIYILSFGFIIVACVAAYILLLFVYFLALSSLHPSTF